MRERHANALEATMISRYAHQLPAKRSAAGPLLALIAGLTIGAALMYLFDPNGGNRRRAHMRDKAKHYRRITLQALRRQAQHGINHAKGMAAEARAKLRHEQVDDQLLHERVRSALGRAVSHPHSIEVGVRDCIVTLSGPVLAHEVDDLVECVWDVRGVADVVDHLQVHEQPGSIPGLQRG
jgi:hypothetical protein